jgi:hypothetical protein
LSIEIESKEWQEVKASTGNVDTGSILFGYVKREHSCVIIGYVTKAGEVVDEFFASYKNHFLWFE